MQRLTQATSSLADISIGLSILHENAFQFLQIHKIHGNCTSATKYKLLLLH